MDHDTTMNAAFDTDSWPGRGWQPPRTKGGWRDNSGPRLLLFASRSGTDAVGPPRVSAGVLAPSRAASPILSPLDHPLVGSSSRVYRQCTHARRFPRASHLAPSCDGVVDRELLVRLVPSRDRSSLSRVILRRTRSKTPRWDDPREPSALEQYSLSERRHSERPCGRPLSEVAPPRTMSWR